MELIHHAIPQPDSGLERVEVEVDRLTLAKRRWRGVAADGREFGFDLESPLRDGDVVFSGDGKVYVIAQQSEPVLEFALGHHANEAARLGWIVGNLHFQIAVEGEVLRVVDDPALRQLFEREHLAFSAADRVFKPISGGHSHSHDHEH